MTRGPGTKGRPEASRLTAMETWDAIRSRRNVRQGAIFLMNVSGAISSVYTWRMIGERGP